MRAGSLRKTVCLPGKEKGGGGRGGYSACTCALILSVRGEGGEGGGDAVRQKPWMWEEEEEGIKQQARTLLQKPVRTCDYGYGSYAFLFHKNTILVERKLF